MSEAYMATKLEKNTQGPLRWSHTDENTTDTPFLLTGPLKFFTVDLKKKKAEHLIAE